MDKMNEACEIKQETIADIARRNSELLKTLEAMTRRLGSFVECEEYDEIEDLEPKCMRDELIKQECILRRIDGNLSSTLRKLGA